MVNAPVLVDFQSIKGDLGSIGVIEASRHVGFDVKRLYFIHDIKGEHVRGKHAHKKLRQFMFCVSGSVRVVLEGRAGCFTFELAPGPRGILVPPGYWRELDHFAPGTVLVVLASEEYDEADYIRDYNDFKTWLEESSSSQPIPYLPLDRQHEELSFEVIRAIGGVVKSGVFIGGDVVTSFEKEFARYCAASYAVGCGNGLDALVVALEALGIGRGDEVVVPANSFIASALAVSMVGATPVFADVDPSTYGLTADTVEAALTPRTVAVMPVHLYGIPVNMKDIRRVAARWGLKVIEDAAQAHGALFQGRPCGSFGDVAGFSFYPTKVLGAIGDGGAVVTNDQALAERIRLLCNYGSQQKYRHEVLGRNSRLDPIQAAVLQTKLRCLPGWQRRRQQLVDRYYQGLQGLSWLSLPQVPADCVPAWHVFPTRVHDRARDELVSFLARQGIQTNKHYPIPIHLQPAYAGLGYKQGDFPVAEAASQALVSLPLDPYHTDEEVDRVIYALRTF